MPKAKSGLKTRSQFAIQNTIGYKNFEKP